MMVSSICSAQQSSILTGVDQLIVKVIVLIITVMNTNTSAIGGTSRSTNAATASFQNYEAVDRRMSNNKSRCGSGVCNSSCSASSSNHPNNENDNNIGVQKDVLYGVQDSGWKSSQWNWGSAIGTGHDCAKICRQRYSTVNQRQLLIERLLSCTCETKLSPPLSSTSNGYVLNFEEIKLILGLAFQRGRWDGRDGGPNGGYGDVLQYLVQAERYEDDDNNESKVLFVKDMVERYPLLNPSLEKINSMNQIWDECLMAINKYDDESSSAERILDVARYRCSGLVLESMGFVNQGL